jgi:uncharacterized HAD superfamily protein/hypoxanthine phosphoribosyltransferase
MLQYRSTSDLAHAVHGALGDIPSSIDAIVGIPRSGVLPASMIALALNRPLAEVGGFLEGFFMAPGRTKNTNSLCRSAADAKHILLVDDSVHSGESLFSSIRAIRERRPDLAVTTFTAYVHERSAEIPDVFAEIVSLPRVFEWNLMHHALLPRACVDIDGILCVDPTVEENDDGLNYAGFLRHARPLLLPSRPIGHLVTSRLERYREATEDWLQRHGVQYGCLHMLDLPDAATRRRLRAHAPFKARIYRRTDTVMFIESDPIQAQAVADGARKPVICPRVGQVPPQPKRGLPSIEANAYTAIFAAKGYLGRKLRKLRGAPSH